MELKRVDLLLILQLISTLLRVYGVALVVPALVAFYFKEFVAASSYFVSGLIIFGGSSAILLFLEKPLAGYEVKLRHAVICLALAWTAVSLTSTIPFIQSGMSFVDAFFESISGWSGTGLTMVPDPSKLPQSLNFFRAFIQWVGGFGIVVLALLLYTRPSTAKRLFAAEGRTENFFWDFKKIARGVVGIFLFYTILGVISLRISGVPFFHAIIHTLTSISTGGYSSNPVGIGLYGAWPMFFGILLMIIGSTSFSSHYDLLTGQFKRFVKNPEIRFMLFIISFAAILIFFEIWVMKGKFFYDGFFYVVSAISGTGAGTPVAVSSFNQVSMIILIFLMICGTCYGSTAGAIKLWRILIIGKIIRREISRHFLPEHAVLPIKVGDQIVNDDQALKVTAYALLYLSLLFIGSFVFMLSGYPTVDSIFTVASAQGNVGLNILPEATYYGMNPLLKLLLSFHMILGRIEIFPFLILVRSFLSSRF
ncbi:TrkH family potassium uptake protein [archaeon]|nr:TrkH family potassium uptake protein [archaeon]